MLGCFWVVSGLGGLGGIWVLGTCMFGWFMSLIFGGLVSGFAGFLVLLVVLGCLIGFMVGLVLVCGCSCFVGLMFWVNVVELLVFSCFELVYYLIGSFDCFGFGLLCRFAFVDCVALLLLCFRMFRCC